MVNRKGRAYLGAQSGCRTVLCLQLFLNKTIKDDFVLLKSESGINFFLITKSCSVTRQAFQLTTFIIKL